MSADFEKWNNEPAHTSHVLPAEIESMYRSEEYRRRQRKHLIRALIALVLTAVVLILVLR